MLVIRPMEKMKEGKEVGAGIGGGQKAKAGIVKEAGVENDAVAATVAIEVTVVIERTVEIEATAVIVTVETEMLARGLAAGNHLSTGTSLRLDSST